jgi:hypothetical protein
MKPEPGRAGAGKKCEGSSTFFPSSFSLTGPGYPSMCPVMLIQKDVPTLPDTNGVRKGNKRRARLPWASMEIGDSFYIEVLHTRARAYVRQAEMKTGFCFIWRREAGGLRFWRVAPDLFDGPSVEIDRDVPPPTDGQRHPRFPWRKLKIGDSFFCQVKPAHIRSYTHQAGKATGRRFTWRKENAGVRVWRIA